MACGLWPDQIFSHIDRDTIVLSQVLTLVVVQFESSLFLHVKENEVRKQ